MLPTSGSRWFRVSAGGSWLGGTSDIKAAQASATPVLEKAGSISDASTLVSRYGYELSFFFDRSFDPRPFETSWAPFQLLAKQGTRKDREIGLTVLQDFDTVDHPDFSGTYPRGVAAGFQYSTWWRLWIGGAYSFVWRKAGASAYVDLGIARISAAYFPAPKAILIEPLYGGGPGEVESAGP
jgi:hypothetical protein